MVGTANSLNIGQQGTVYFDGTSIFTGVDGGTAGNVLTSNGTGVAPSFQAGGGGSVTISGDTGSMTGSNLTLFANNTANNAGSTVKFVNSGTTSTLNVTDGAANTLTGLNAGNLTLSGIANTGFGQSVLSGLTGGNQNTAMGNGALLSVNSGGGNAGFGYLSGQGITTGINNCAFGSNVLSANPSTGYNNGFGVLALQVCTGNFNNAIGFSALQNVTGSENTVIGHASGYLLTGASNNTIIGSSSGQAYTSTESNNILIGQGVSGTVSESNVTRIGNAQTTAYMAGISGVSVANQQTVAIDSTTGQLGAVAGSPQVVMKSVNIDLKATGDTILFTTTAPFVVLEIVAYGLNLSGVIAGAIANYGWTAAAYSDLVSNSTVFATATGNANTLTLSSISTENPVIPTATAFRINVTTADATATDNTQVICVTGFYL